MQYFILFVLFLTHFRIEIEILSLDVTTLPRQVVPIEAISPEGLIDYNIFLTDPKVSLLLVVCQSFSQSGRLSR